MCFINRLFRKEKIECPRCLGKGHVDGEDIKRLGRELKWIPSTCAYCLGERIVNANLPTKIAVDMTYLTTDLSSKERKRLLRKEEGAMQRAIAYDTQIDNFIAEVKYLHFSGKMETNKICAFYLLHQPEASAEYRKENLDYIQRVIEQVL